MEHVLVSTAKKLNLALQFIETNILQENEAKYGLVALR
jgi:hypothetical protein